MTPLKNSNYDQVFQRHVVKPSTTHNKVSLLSLANMQHQRPPNHASEMRNALVVEFAIQGIVSSAMNNLRHYIHASSDWSPAALQMLRDRVASMFTERVQIENVSSVMVGIRW